MGLKLRPYDHVDDDDNPEEPFLPYGMALGLPVNLVLLYSGPYPQLRDI